MSRYWDVPTAVLLILLVQISSLRLVVTEWTAYLYFTQTLAFFGSLIGLAIGISRFRSRAAFWLAVTYGTVLIPWQLTSAIEEQLPVLEELGVLGWRLLFSFDQFLMRKPVDDALFFVALVAIAYFAIALAAGYWLTRHGNFLVGVILTGMPVLIIHAYDSFLASRLWIAAVFSFATLLLLGRVHFVRERERWASERVFLSPDSGQDINRQIMVLAAVAILVTWTIPVSIEEWKAASAAWSRFTRPMRERFSNAVSALESPYGTRESSDFYGIQLSLGRTAAQGDTPVFLVKVEESLEVEPPRYYWRGRVYDQYLNGRWTNRPTNVSDFDPLQDLLEAVIQTERGEARFTVTMKLQEQSLLYMPAEPFWVNRKGSVETIQVPDQGQEVTAWKADPALTAESRYQVRALVGNPTVRQLRDAGTDYPGWVTQRYLQVPEELEPEIRGLTETVIAGRETPYDMAAAITRYLRTELEYSTALNELPQDRDPLLWVLFDYKKGFCMYYASAEVMMLRSVGIPARLAVGFAEGSYDEDGQTYTVVRTDAHAWPEVYFPGLGWVEFEPTANQDPLSRPVGEPRESAGPVRTPLPDFGDDSLIERPSRDPNDLEPLPTGEGGPAGYLVTRSIYFILAAGSIAVGIFLTRRYALAERLPVYLESRYRKSGSQPPYWLLRWSRWVKLTSVEKSFEAINLSLRWLGHPPPVHITPGERARKLRLLLPGASEHIDILMEEQQTALFTPRAGNSIRARRAGLKVILETWRARLRKIGEYL